MVFNGAGAVYKQQDKATVAVKAPKADIESPKVVKASEEAPAVEEAPKVEPKKSGSRKKAKK